MKPITAEERRAWGLELASVRPARERPRDYNGRPVERVFTSYVGALDIPEVKLLAIECVRRLMRGGSRDRKVELTAWLAQAARAIIAEEFGYLTDRHIPGASADRLFEQRRASDKARARKAAGKGKS